MEGKRLLTIAESRIFIEKLNNICMDCSKICDSIVNLLSNTSKCRNISTSYEEELLGNF